jgi:hypothetical protein
LQLDGWFTPENAGGLQDSWWIVLTPSRWFTLVFAGDLQVSTDETDNLRRWFTPEKSGGLKRERKHHDKCG